MAVKDMYKKREEIKKVGGLKELLKEEDMKERYIYLDRLYFQMKKAGIKQVELNPDVDQSSLQVPTFVKLSLTEQDVAAMFIEHRWSSRSMIAERWGIERLFGKDDPKKPNNVIQRMYADVVKNPDKYKDWVDKECIEDIQRCVQTRLVNHEASGDVLMQYKSVKHVMARPIVDMTHKLEKVHEKSLNLLDLKLSNIKTRKDVQKEDLAKIAGVVKITAEQSRLAKGEATQHVAHIIKSTGIDEMGVNQLVDILNQQKEDMNSD